MMRYDPGMTDTSSTPVETDQDIPNPDALGLIPHFDPPAGEEHPDDRPVES
jgi:hypothetical protein